MSTIKDVRAPTPEGTVLQTDPAAVAQARVGISAIIPVSERFDPPSAVLEAYRKALESTGEEFEIIYVLDGPQPRFMQQLAIGREGLPKATIIQLKKPFGEVACLNEGIRRARGDILFILPAYLQVEPASIVSLLTPLRTADIIVASRDRRHDNAVNRMRGWAFRLAGRLVGNRFDDPGCVVKVVRRHVFDELELHVDQHPFLPLLAQRLGFVAEQVKLPQAKMDQKFRGHHTSTYAKRLLDILALGFLLWFIQRPFRFFGTIGAAFVAMGLLAGVYIIAQRSFMGVALADRPALLFVALLIVLGIQIGAVGLIAEIVIFTRSRRNPTYRVETIIEQGQPFTHDRG